MRRRLLALVLAFAVPAAAAAATSLTTSELQALGQQDAQQYGVPWSIFQAQIQGESSWNPNIGCNSKGACGIGQFMPATAAQFGIDPNNPQQSLQAAAQYDAQLYKQTGSWTGALTDYTGGMTAATTGNNVAYAQAFAAAQQADLGIAQNGNGMVAVPSYSTAAPATTPTTGAMTNNGLPAGALDNFTQDFQNFMTNVGPKIYPIALDLFSILAAIELFVMLFGLLVMGERPLWSDVVMEVVRWFFVIGLFAWLMESGPTYMGDIVNSLRLAGTAAGAPAITPSALWAVGNNASSALTQQALWSINPAFFIPVGISADILEIVFALTVAWLVVALVTSYFVIGFAALFLAFGALRWAREIAISVIRYALAVGAKLMALEVIVGVLSGFVQQWLANPTQLNAHGVTTLLGISILMCAVAKILPDEMQRLITGSPVSLAHHAHLTEAAALAAVPVAVGAGAVMTMHQAQQLASAQMAAKIADGTAPANPAMRAAMMMGSVIQHTAASAGRAAANTIGYRLGGRGGAVFWQAATDLSQRRRVAEAESNKPSPPSS